MAAKFTFSLQPALDAARHEAEQCQQAFLTAKQTVSVERQRLSDNLSAKAQALDIEQDARRTARDTGETTVEGLQTMALRISAAESRVEQCEAAVSAQQRRLGEAEIDAKRCQTEWVAAESKVKALETLRDRQAAAFAQGLALAEDAEIEEAARQLANRRPLP